MAWQAESGGALASVSSDTSDSDVMQVKLIMQQVSFSVRHC